MSEIKCKFCGSSTIEEPQFEEAEDYGDFMHVCLKCGSIGKECFGHGIYWETPNYNNCEDFPLNCYYCKKLNNCKIKNIK